MRQVLYDPQLLQQKAARYALRTRFTLVQWQQILCHLPDVSIVEVEAAYRVWLDEPHGTWLTYFDLLKMAVEYNKEHIR